MNPLDNNTDQNFAKEVEDIVKRDKCSHMEAVLEWAVEHNLEPEYCAKLISKNLALKSKIQFEAEDLHYLKRTVRLAI